MRSFSRLVSFAAAAAVVLVAGCAGRSGGPLVPSGFAPNVAPAAASAAVPKACKGQKTTATYASLTQTLSGKGGSLCIPASGGFGGTIYYPGASPSVKLGLTSSATNYKHLPLLGKGKPIFYLQLALSGATTFGTKVSAGGGLTGKAIVAGKVYTAVGEATVDGFSVPFTPCYVTATKGAYGGVIGGLGTLLKSQSAPAAATGLVEIYPGKQSNATGTC
ncbi:MAG TPA: hypothetical protein VMH02_09330 [Verrucomicrobiae bacterium]|nr:hypothetical protein [Verrucomicrobiae bacterium]